MLKSTRRLALTTLLAILAGCSASAQPPHGTGALVVASLSEASLRVMQQDMDPAIRALAWRHDPSRREPDPWGRSAGWASLDVRDIPDLGLGQLEAASARQINAMRPFAPAPIRPMRPFVLAAGDEDRARALQCLTQAVYYEAAHETREGQEAVAQVVLNRVRHPAYPKSVCGVVYQGSARVTGCQFTFTCDGALGSGPDAALWARAQAVARRALAGYVAKAVGSATHYHADYVAPYWAPTLVKLRQVGAHIFYRWTGPWGEPPAFTGRYVGREALLTAAVLEGDDGRVVLAPELAGEGTPRKVVLDVAGEVRTYAVADPARPDGVKSRVLGAINAPRRQPTAAEVTSINASMAVMEAGLGETAITPPPSAAPAP